MLNQCRIRAVNEKWLVVDVIQPDGVSLIRIDIVDDKIEKIVKHLISKTWEEVKNTLFNHFITVYLQDSLIQYFMGVYIYCRTTQKPEERK